MAIRSSRSKISRHGDGRVGFKERDLGDLLTLYGVTDPEVTARDARPGPGPTPRWWRSSAMSCRPGSSRYLGLEASASADPQSFDLQFVHGLFQTEAYARAVTPLGQRGVCGRSTGGWRCG